MRAHTYEQITPNISLWTYLGPHTSYQYEEDGNKKKRTLVIYKDGVKIVLNGRDIIELLKIIG